MVINEITIEIRSNNVLALLRPNTNLCRLVFNVWLGSNIVYCCFVLLFPGLVMSHPKLSCKRLFLFIMVKYNNSIVKN